jgi:hypothetical protein
MEKKLGGAVVWLTGMNGYHCFNFTEKTFLQSVDPKQPKMSNFHFDLSLELSQGEVQDFSGKVQKSLGEVQNDLGGTHLPSKSGHAENRNQYILTPESTSNSVRSKF